MSNLKELCLDLLIKDKDTPFNIDNFFKNFLENQTLNSVKKIILYINL